MPESIGNIGFQSFQMGSTQSPFCAINAAYDGLVKVPAVTGVSAIKAKSLAVTFNGPVDTTKAVFAVKKGASTVTVSEVIWNADKTVAELVDKNLKISDNISNHLAQKFKQNKTA